MRSSRRGLRSKRPAALVVTACLLAACSGGGKTVTAKPDPTPTPSATPTATRSPAPVPTDPLTGLPRRGSPSLVAIKVDNAPLARPYQTGLGRAAIVYQELVEGGSTRFLAVYEADRAGTGEVGPIRSARESDVPLMRLFGRIPLAFSGAQPGVVAIVHAAQRYHWLVDASYDAIPGAYRLGARRADARNFFAVPAELTRRRPGQAATDIGLRFGAATPGLPTHGARLAFSPQATVSLTYIGGRWRVTQSGRVMPGVAPLNVIIQRVREKGSRFVDVHGMPTPYTVTTGSGSAVVLRGGQRVVARWTRSGVGPIHYLDRLGHDVRLAPGPTWVLLVPTTGSATFS
jgi:hypothetical protein